MEKQTVLETIVLKHGGHKSAEDGMCLLEAVAYVAGEPFGDRPQCVDTVLGAYGRAVNDFMTDNARQLLVPLIPKLIGTVGDHTLSLRRAMLICDGTIRQILPLAFEGIGLVDVASTLRNLAEVKDESSASAARSAASAAWSAARSAASAADSAADSAAGAAWSAASAADSAAYNAAWSAASAASAAWSAASAAWSAASAASAAWSAASAVRKPIIDALVSIFSAAIEIKS